MMEAAEVAAVRTASRRLVREFGFLNGTLAGTRLSASAVHALIEIGTGGAMTASELCHVLLLEKSSVSRMVGKLIAGGEIVADAHDADSRAKRLTLTDQGRRTLRDVDDFAHGQVFGALAELSPPARSSIVEGLSAYADALTARRTGSGAARSPVDIARGYRPGLVGRGVEMHGRFYARSAGFGLPFERKVAAEMAEFVGRLGSPANQVWSASINGSVAGMIAIDGEDLSRGHAHLRWFIVEDGVRGTGIGRRLLVEAVAFCDAQGFAETHLWTFRGLYAARRLYEAQGFALAEEQIGRQWGEEVIEQRFVRTAAASRSRA